MKIFNFTSFVKSTGKLFFDWLTNSGDPSLIKKICSLSLFFHPKLRGLYHYRIGHLRKAKILLALGTKSNTFYDRIYLRVNDMLDVIENGWVEPKHREYTSDGKKVVVMTLHNSLPHDATGYALRSHEVLCQLKKTQWNVSVCTRPGYPKDLSKHRNLVTDSIDHVNGITYNRLFKNDLSIGDPESEYIADYAEILAAKAKFLDAKIIHAASNYLNGLAAVTAARKLGIYSIYEMRGFWHFSRAVREPLYENTEHFQYCHICEIAAASSADAVIAISTPQKNYLIQEGIPEKRITVVPNAADTIRFHPISPNKALLKELGLENKLVIGFVGSLTKYEGIDLVIRAVDKLARSGMNVALLIVGNGYVESELKALARKMTHSECIVFTGFVPNHEIEQYYSIIDIFPFPRRDLKVCRLIPPLKPLEVMAMGKPTIVSDLPPLTEMVKHEKNGLVCRADDVNSLTDCLKTLCNSSEIRHNLSHTALNWVRKNRSWNENRIKLIELYDGLIHFNKK